MSTSSAANMVNGVGKQYSDGDRERSISTRPPEAEWIADLSAERDHE